ncbi:MAG: hypothetical protein QGI43_00075, partial [Gemmatimonadota bacterium]|nr:hypothetical protein [Gemmatimonadota bacterium]
MTAHPLATARAAEAFLACPADGARLKTGPGEVTCPSCGTRWPRIGKVPVFSDPDGYWGEIPQREMEPLLEEAELEGWDRALRRRLLGETGELRDRPDAGADEEGAAPRGRFLYDYATDASRADWRFLLPLNEDSRVLDIGAGWGALSMAIAPEVGLVVAADDMVERARFLEIRARQSGFDHVQPIATPAQD